MKLQALSPTGTNTITALGPDHIRVNEQVLNTSFIVTPDSLLAPWPPRNIDELSDADVQQIADLSCQIVLLGTGVRQQFPHPSRLRPLIERQIGVEVMDSGAACRTYNILVAEGRSVAAAIMLDGSA